MSQPRSVVIVAAQRTAIGSFLGCLKDVPATTLGSTVIADIVKRTGINADRIDEVIMGQLYTGGKGANPARQAALGAGLPHSSSAMTINMVCGSGLRAIALGAQAILCGDRDVVIAGGMESMSQAPFVVPAMRQGQKMGHGEVIDSLIHDALWDPFYDCHMGITAENLADKYAISREAQDTYAALSQQRCEHAMAHGRFKEEITPYTYADRKGTQHTVDTDEFPRAGVTAESIASLKPAFKKDGTVTAANASGINDGAAAVLLMEESAANQLGLTPLARIRAHATAGVDPKFMGIGPAYATPKALERAGLSLDDIDLMEVNEAFAAQTLAVEKELKWNHDRVNVNGGSIALGHPVGASGARIVATLLHEMKRRDSQTGLASLCIGGGMGVAMVFERSGL